MRGAGEIQFHPQKVLTALLSNKPIEEALGLPEAALTPGTSQPPAAGFAKYSSPGFAVGSRFSASAANALAKSSPSQRLADCIEMLCARGKYDQAGQLLFAALQRPFQDWDQGRGS